MKDWVQGRDQWLERFERILQLLSVGEFEKHILEAKSQFFERIGKAHQMAEDRYESASQSFLEWYVFDYQMKSFSKSPAIVFLTRTMGTEEDREFLRKTLYHHWGLFEVLSWDANTVKVKDLIVNKERRILFDEKDASCRVWKREKSQIVQARLFYLKGLRGVDLPENSLFATHVWLHSPTEHELLKRVCESYRNSWSLQKVFLRECLDCLLRSLSLQNQMAAVKVDNWMYQELRKKYAA